MSIPDLTPPFPHRVSPDADAANAHTVRWLLDHRLLRAGEEAAHFSRMRVGPVVALWFPDAEGDDLDLAADAVSFVSVVDDHADGPAAERAHVARQVCTHLSSHLRHGTPLPDDDPFTTAWRSIWQRLTHHRTPAWTARARKDAAVLFEALGASTSRTPLTLDAYFERRKSHMRFFWTLAERTGHYDVPEAFRSGSLADQLMAEAGKLVCMAHDVHAVHREKLRGEVDNTVIVLERVTGSSEAEALALTQELFRRACARFLALKARVPDLCASLGLDESRHTAVLRSVEALEALARGTHDWQTGGSARYDETPPPTYTR